MTSDDTLLQLNPSPVQPASVPEISTGGQPAFAAEPKLRADDFKALRDFVHEKSGIYFPESKMYLVKNRLANRVRELGIRSYRDYLYMVKYDATQREFNVLMNLLTTNETSFFRNLPQLKAFSDEVLMMILDMKKKSGGNSLRIWSAGCSTGEEPYTLAMLLRDKIPDKSLYNIEIIANDISENVLRAARRAMYHEISLRTTPKIYIDKYFTRSGSLYKLSDEIKNMIKFSHINLIDQLKMSLIKDVDIIFCRNVTIYFSDEAKRKITRYFYNSLVRGGYYFIGHSESLHGISRAFKLVYLRNGLAYQKV